MRTIVRKDDEDYFSPKLRVRIKDNNNSPHGKFHRFLFPFSSKFSDLNFASYVLYRVRTGPEKPGKSWNVIMTFSRTGKSWKKATGPGKFWKSVKLK